MVAKIVNNQITFLERPVAPDNPPSGSSLIYPDGTPEFKQINDAGTASTLQSRFNIRDRYNSVSLVDRTAIIVPEGLVDAINDITFYTYPIPTRRSFVAYDPSRVASGNFLGGYGYSVYGSGTVTTNKIAIVTTTTSGISYGVKPNGATPTGRTHWMETGNDLYFYANIVTGASIANTAIYIGVTSAAIETDDIGSNQGAYFRFSTAASDGNWKGIVHASSANRTVQDLGIAVATATEYELALHLAANGVRFFINDTYITQVTYPSGFGGLAVGSQFTIQTLDTNTKTLNVYQVYLEGNA